MRGGLVEEAADVARELRREARELLERARLVIDRARIARGVDALGREQPARAAERVVAELVLEAARAHRRAARLRVVPAALGVGARREPVDEELARAHAELLKQRGLLGRERVALPVEREPLELGDALVQHALLRGELAKPLAVGERRRGRRVAVVAVGHDVLGGAQGGEKREHLVHPQGGPTTCSSFEGLQCPNPKACVIFWPRLWSAKGVGSMLEKWTARPAA